MRFITSAILALAAISSTVVAQLNPNAITKPDGSVPLKAGETTEITWIPSTSPSTITLRLRKGPSGSLSKGDVIAGGIANGGSFSWAIPKDTPAGTDYAITITDDAGTVPENFTPLLTIISDAAEKTTTSDTATSDTTTTTSGPATGYTTGTHTKPHNSTMTTITGRNTTAITASSNATMTVSDASETSASETTEEITEETPTSTGTGSGDSEPSATTNTGGAVSLLSSPLALVVCVLGAVFYLN